MVLQDCFLLLLVATFVPILMTIQPGIQKLYSLGREHRKATLPLPLLRLREIQKVPNINRVNFMFVHIFSQAVLERSNYRARQRQRNPNFKAKN